MEILEIIEKNVNQRFIDHVVETLKDGGLIIYPTDTVYALGCDALNNQAIERICSLKEMKSAKTNLSIICDDISQVAQYAKFDNTQFSLPYPSFPRLLRAAAPWASVFQTTRLPFLSFAPWEALS